jgi:Flp pilus assembly protein TadB
LYLTGGTNHAISKEEQVCKEALGEHEHAGIQPALRENARGTSQEQAPLISNDDQKKHLAVAGAVVGVAVVVVVVDGVGAVVAVGVGVVVAVVVAVAVVDVVGLVLTHKRRFSK